METVIRVDHVGKAYRITRTVSRYRTLQEDVISLLRRPLRRGDAPSRSEIFWALQDISFEVKQGEVVGIIGRNGAGKSTLLKILSRITRPTTGSIDLYGRIGSLLEVGTGFHPELSGRENIFLNGAVLGMTRGEIRRKFDEIVAFAQVEQFLETPVKRYSSGMYMRLAFAVAAHLEPEILVVDEVLAVGDAEFQKKSLGKMSEVAQEGRTVLFVSHNMAAVESLCQRGILLEHGRVIFDGSQTDAIRHYTGSILANISTAMLIDRPDRKGSGIIQVSRIYLQNKIGETIEFAQSGEECVFCFEYDCPLAEIPHKVSIAFAVFDANGRPLFRNSTDVLNQNFESLPPTGVIRCVVPALPIIKGDYTMGYLITVSGEWADYLDDATRFTVVDGDFFRTGRIELHSPFLVHHTWHVRENLHDVGAPS